ncbi:repressor of RNA polymerase III transcription MAF1, partial [Rhizodiscina lignyota]
QFLPISEIEEVSSTLSFETGDCIVLGACELYTTKTTGDEKKLYRNVEKNLEEQHETVLRLSASLSPPDAETFADQLNLSRSSPFGPLSQPSSRRTFAHLIATLNASHPDYDFSHLRPQDFKRVASVRSARDDVDEAIYNLQPKALRLADLMLQRGQVHNAGGGQIWGPHMWDLIDKEMGLKGCTVYTFLPDEDPLTHDDGAVWSLNYFFFSKERKRVCYMYLRGLSALSHSPVNGPSHKRNISEGIDYRGSTASKRAKYWLGESLGYDVDNDDYEVMSPQYLGVFDDDYDEDDDEFLLEKEKSPLRAMSEQLMESMEF